MKESVESSVALMEAVRTCRNCGAVVSKDAAFGHCPRCLLELGFINAPTDTKPKSPAAKLQFGDYELLEQIGRGGMGVVYRARQISLNRIVALKMVLDSHLASPVVLRRFLIEAEAAAKLEHPNIVRIYAISEVEGQHFFSMRLIEGESLDRKIAHGEYEVAKGKTRLTGRDKAQEKIATLMATVARAVHYAHERGVLHRDLKPSNILIDAAGDPHLTDFGLAKVSGAQIGGRPLTATTTVLGTPGYMSPEQASSDECTAAADIYSLGAILYELLVGNPPFEAGTPLETMRKTMHEDPLHPRRIKPAIDADLATICLKCLERDPVRRYATANDLAIDLERWQRHETISARPATLLTRSHRWVQRNRAGTAVIVCLVCGLGVALGLLERAREEEQSKRAALGYLKRSLGSQIHGLGKPTPDFFEISSEQLASFAGGEPRKRRPTTRIKVATFVFSNPTETVIDYGKMFRELEITMAKHLGTGVAIDYRLYFNYLQAGKDLGNGEIEFLRADPRLMAYVMRQSPVIQITREEGISPATAVIFARADTGITSLDALAGRSLVFWDTQSGVSLQAKAVLARHNLCATNVECTYLIQEQGPGPSNRTHLEAPEQGYFDRQGETVRQVLDLKRFDAGVARLRQFRLKRKDEFVELARFEVVRNVWLGSSKVPVRVSQAFRRSLEQWDPTQGDPRLSMDTGFGAGHEVKHKPVEPILLETIEKALDLERQFNTCAGQLNLIEKDSL